jgi:nucleoside-diphosphate-sugar epimerase
MKILLIGGTGQISTSVTNQLLARGHQIAHLNRGQTSTHGEAAANVRRIVGDRKAFPTFEAAMQAGEAWDCVIDMICFLPAEAESLVRAFRGKTKHLILTSTVDVYARPQATHPIREDAPRGGVSAYGKAKVVCEDIVLAAGARGDFGATILRPAHTVNNTGRIHNSFGKADPRLFDRYARNLPVIVHGDGSSLWTVCHADDAAVAYAGAAGNPKTFGRAYHLPGPEAITWNDFHRRAAAAIGAPPPKLVHIPTDVLHQLNPERAAISTENFQFNNCFDATATRTDLGFNPQISFDECIRRIHRHLAKNKLIERAETDADYDRVLDHWARHTAALVTGFKA